MALGKILQGHFSFTSNSDLVSCAPKPQMEICR